MYTCRKTAFCVGLLLIVASSIPARATASDLKAAWATNGQTINARFDASWRSARSAIRLDRGWLFARNDGKNLYLLIDLIGDASDDKPLTNAPWGDYVALTFDVDLDRKVTVDKDLKLVPFWGSYRMGWQRFLGPGRFSPQQPSGARLAAGFGRSILSPRAHRIWELSIPLAEIDAKAGGRVRMGVETHSVKPAFSEELPVNHTRELQALIEIDLASNPTLFKVVTLAPGALQKPVSRQRLVVRPNFELMRPQLNTAPGTLTAGGAGQSPPCPLPEGDPVGRAILADGTVELRYANGSKKLRKRGGWQILCPDGTPVPTTVLFSTQIPPTLPPTLPDESEAQWLDYHNAQLLGIIGTLVNDDAMVATYLGTEAESWSSYQRIQSRSETISFLLAE